MTFVNDWALNIKNKPRIVYHLPTPPPPHHHHHYPLAEKTLITGSTVPLVIYFESCMCELSLSFSLVLFSSLHQMGVGWGLCICVRVYLCMGWRGVDGVKVCVIDKLIVSDNRREFLYDHYNVYCLHGI